MVGLLTLLLDVTKGAVPVGLAYYTLGFRGVPMFLIAIAPILGHVYTPFLGFHGGKALSTALGVWIGLTIWKASLAGVAGVLVGIAVFTTAGWAVMLGLGVIWAVLWVWMRDALLLSVLAGEMIILAWTHRSDLRHGPHLRPWLARLCFQAKDRSRHG